MIRVHGITAHWGGFTLKGIDLKINQGEYFVILGPTGAGKTLLLELLAGFWAHEKGNIEIFGENAEQRSPEERGMGFVYQDYMLFPHLNVYDNIGFGLKLKNISAAAIQRKVRAIVKMLGITDLLHRDVSTLSGGEAQRVALARALVLEPKILLLDEPLSALDPNIQERVRAEIKDLHKKFGITTIHVTHNREEAIIMADRIAVMENGRIFQVGTPEEIFRKPASRFIAEFVGVQNIFSGQISKKGLVEVDELVGGPIFTTSRLKGKVTITVRPEDIIISPEKVRTSARNVIFGTVVGMTDRGTVIKVDINAGREFSVYITRQALEDLGINIGSEVYLMFKASAVHVFKGGAA